MICGIIDTKAVEVEIELYVNDKCPPFCLIDKILARNLLDARRYFSEFNYLKIHIGSYNKSRFGLKQVGFGETMSAPGPSPCHPPGWPFTVLFKGYNHF